MSKKNVSIRALKGRGIEVLNRGGGTVSLPENTVLEAPCSLKWTQYEHSIHLGAFSYQVSGYCFAARIGRYCSFGEDVQIGRQNHPTTWVSTSPAFYIGDRLFDLDKGFDGSEGYHTYKFDFKGPATLAKVTTIGNDVWIGHGAYIAAGVTIGDGAIVGANSVVTRDVPAYGVVAGNPAVLKKMRVSSMLITPLMRVKWWQYAPWQMDHLDPTNILEFIKGTQKLNAEAAPYQPAKFDLRTDKP